MKTFSDIFSAFFPLPKIEGKGWLYDRSWLGREGLALLVKLLRARREMAGRGTYSRQFDLHDIAGPLKLLPLTLTSDLEQENQGTAEGAKKALNLSESGPI